jgi:hypothetical protein
VPLQGRSNAIYPKKCTFCEGDNSSNEGWKNKIFDVLETPLNNNKTAKQSSQKYTNTTRKQVTKQQYLLASQSNIMKLGQWIENGLVFFLKNQDCRKHVNGYLSYVAIDEQPPFCFCPFCISHGQQSP